MRRAGGVLEHVPAASPAAPAGPTPLRRAGSLRRVRRLRMDRIGRGAWVLGGRVCVGWVGGGGGTCVLGEGVCVGGVPGGRRGD